MGLSSSKHSAAGTSSTLRPPPSRGAFSRRTRSVKSRVLNSSRLQPRSSNNEDAKVTKCWCKENGKTLSCSSKKTSNCTNSIAVSEDGGTSREFSSCSLNPPTRFLSRLSFYPGNLSFRSFRARSLESSAGSFTATSIEKDEFIAPSSGVVNRNGGSRGCDFFPSCFANRSFRRHEDNSGLDSSAALSEDDDHHPSHSVNDRSNTREADSLHQYNHIQSDDPGVRHSERMIPAREPVERNVRFSRTLSVGRLRDRVLRRAAHSDIELSHFQSARELRLSRHVSARQEFGTEAVDIESDTHASLVQHVSSDNPSSGREINIQETTRARAREARYTDLLEHRSHFLERRRRIRSHVRALQRLGSRFESLSSHERSCILSGHHRGGLCDCQIAPQEASTNDDGNATASISRIVMLAEALFEVLDEIHQQSVVLSSRTPASSIGSIPAPNEVVESLPLKVFSTLKKKSNEDTAQCYICLIEYEEGDNMRILPCHHEFHRTCIDKWLKEIHRVCPLCRGDICRPDPSTV